MKDFIFLIFGIIGLWIGTNLTVKQASHLAKQWNWSELFIGLTIIAFGTDLPELAVAIKGSLNNLKGEESSGIIVGNAIGSSICQISIVIGATAIFHYLSIGKIRIRLIGLELIGSILLFMLVAYDGVVTWDDGIILIITFFIYIITNFQREVSKPKRSKEKVDTSFKNMLPNVLLLILGLVVVAVSSEVTLHNALLLAESWGVKQSFIGAILLGLGTSLPELAISITAVLNKKPSISVGNVIGSNIFDLLIPIGIGAMISDIHLERSILFFDVPVLFFISIIVLWFLAREKGLQKWEGMVLIILYVIYAFFKYLI